MAFLKKFFGQKSDQQSSLYKTNLNEIYNKSPFQKKQITSTIQDQKKLEQFELVLEQQIIDLEALKKLTWRGIPNEYRAKVWKLIVKYIPPNHMSQTTILLKKRQDYQQYIKNYYEHMNEQERDENERKIIKIIQNDVLRTQPDYKLFRDPRIQEMFKRLLFIWNMRHPMSGYVQGINDVASPLIVVFLNEYVPIDFNSFDVPSNFDKLPEEILIDIEADIYWCLCKIIENIQDYFTANQPGVQEAYVKIRELIKILDYPLYQYFEDQQIDLNHFAFRWVLCLLIREFPLSLTIRLLDTYLAEGDEMANLHVYTVTNLILKCAPEIKSKNMSEAVIFLQNLPTKEWTEVQLEMLLQEAFVFQDHFEKTKGHLKLNQGNTNRSSIL
ncbi:unnamed protein product [Paramecium pentaurelia]|uniref:Rab-GAP TBC domain-containing protein n=1 Tax=Paramecium pentaurelia TaxID=43138 RepID=A0A8S1Y128_9CILI|nr:unnamed protein product [Paramecium pentaurelia]